MPVWGPEYEIKLNLKINSWISSWGSILRFTADPAEGNCCNLGQRIPALWTRNGTTDQLHLVTDIDSNGNYEVNNPNMMGLFQPGRWYELVISQKKDGVCTG